MSQANLAVVFDHLHAMRRRDMDDIASRLSPEIVHQGVRDDLICEGREQVLENMRGNLRGVDFGIDRIEIVDGAERVVVGLAGPRFREVPWAPLQGEIFVVYTVRDGQIVRMDDYLTRAQALAAAQVTQSDRLPVEERVTPILRVEDAQRAVAWYQRLGFSKVSEHRFGPGMPAFVTVKRGSMQLFLSEHTGDARPNTLIYLTVSDVDPIAAEFGLAVENQPWGREVEIRDPDGNRLRVGSPLT